MHALMHSCTHACLEEEFTDAYGKHVPRKKSGLEAARFDLEYGKCVGKPGSHDFLAPQGFLS